MSTRTTIGGINYESVGSSGSNLLLKCNGTARIQWGNKLIDLIKNGKLAVNNESLQIYIVTDKSEIKTDGIYILNTGTSKQLWIHKDNESYDLTSTDLYISASTKQDVTVEQRKQALKNIGLYYQTLEEVKTSGIDNGLVYVIETEKIYTIKNGIISEFKAGVEPVTVDKTKLLNGDTIDTSVNSLDDFVTLINDELVINKPVNIESNVQFGSRNADENRGYRLYFQGELSCLDVDIINARSGLNMTDFIDIKHSELLEIYQSDNLIPHQWYLISDYQNYWKLPAESDTNNRPILVRALSSSSFYPKGYLFKDRRVEIQYDIEFTETIMDQTARGKIIWMKDSYNNEANFDFLDYVDADGFGLTILHANVDNPELDKSIFPANSFNNKITAYNLKGITVTNGILDNNTAEIAFHTPMNNNTIVCNGITVSSKCLHFDNNTLIGTANVIINSSEFIENKISNWYSTEDKSISSFSDITSETQLTNIVVDSNITNLVTDKLVNSTITHNISDCVFREIINSTLNCTLYNASFISLINCVIEEGSINNVISHSIINDYTINQNEHLRLYNSEEIKNIYFDAGVLTIKVTDTCFFSRGMIIMHSGIESIPEGWALCDGREYTYNGVTSTTPNLVNRFIKAVSDQNEIGIVNNPNLTVDNKLTLTENHLPSHSHPHTVHSHDVNIISNSINVNSSGTQIDVMIPSENKNIKTNSTISEEDINNKVNDTILIEPNHYALLFIMKL